MSIEPLDEDGVAAVTVGTILWLVLGAVLFFFFRDELAAHDTSWWLIVCLVGAGFGVLGRAYAVRRRRAYRSAEESL